MYSMYSFMIVHITEQGKFREYLGNDMMEVKEIVKEL